MSEFVIEDGVEICEKAPGTGRKIFYPFSELSIGQCFFVPGSIRTNKEVSSAAYAFGKKTGRSFTIRKTGNGCRVWRTK